MILLYTKSIILLITQIIKKNAASLFEKDNSILEVNASGETHKIDNKEKKEKDHTDILEYNKKEIYMKHL